MFPDVFRSRSQRTAAVPGFFSRVFRRASPVLFPRILVFIGSPTNAADGIAIAISRRVWHAVLVFIGSPTNAADATAVAISRLGYRNLILPSPCRAVAVPKEMSGNAVAHRNGGRIESTFQSRAAPPLSWCVCSLPCIFVSRSMSQGRCSKSSKSLCLPLAFLLIFK